MFAPWQYLVFLNIPLLLVNMVGIYLSVFFIKDRKRADFCWTINTAAFVMTLTQIVTNSWDVVSK